MIGQPSWFKIRKYGGWGLTPAKKEGWLYMLAFVIPLIFIQSVFPFSEQTKFYISFIWTFLLLLDVLDIMFKIKKDEREYMHEAIAERNVSWFLIFSLVIGFMYKTISTGTTNQPVIDLYLLIPLLGAALVKTLTHLYLRDK